MQLRRISYLEHVDSAQNWEIDGLDLGDRNLLVGRNATGKSRAVNIISSLANNIMGLTTQLSNGRYSCIFVEDDSEWTYNYNVVEGAVVAEELFQGDFKLLTRGEGGVGTIRAVELDLEIKFQTPTDVLALVARRDEIQHPFLQPIHDWAASVRHYRFNTALGKDNYGVIVQDGVALNDRDPNAVIPIFRAGRKEFGEEFVHAVIADLACVDYHIDEVDTRAPVSIKFLGAPNDLVGLVVKERDIEGLVDQHAMSTGMFRVLSLLIQFNYIRFKSSAGCLIVDDIGEGLDFSRSCALIKLLRQRSEELGIQLILTTNDKFIMNEVPLDEWSVLQRCGSVVNVLNVANSPALFEDFKFTGLSNFSFLEMDFANSAVH